MSRLFFFVIILWIVMSVLAFQSLDTSLQVFLCLNPYYSLLCVFRNVFLFERSKKNVFFSDTLYSYTPTMSSLIWNIFLSIMVSWIFIWYWEKIYPGRDLIDHIHVKFVILGEYGIGLPWTFPFSMQYWKSSLKKPNSLRKTSSEDSLNSNLDDDSIIVKIEALCKFFPQANRMAVDNVHFNLYENQITGILGHNGAGP